MDHDAYQAADVLLQLGANATDALMLAVEARKLWFLETFRSMVVCHPSPISRRMLERMDWAQCAVARGHTPLTLAIFFERYDAMRLLLCDGQLPVHLIDEPVHSLSAPSSSPTTPSPANLKRKCTAMHIALIRRNADAILLLGAARAMAPAADGDLLLATAAKRRRRTSVSVRVAAARRAGASSSDPLGSINSRGLTRLGSMIQAPGAGG